MATYEYRCGSCGDVFTVRRQIGTASATATCPSCAADALRVFSAPQVSLSSGRASSLRAAEEKSSDAPEVVSRPPERQRRVTRPQNPLWSKLPKP